MKEKRLRPSDIEWQKQKKENHQNNVALFEGVKDGRLYRQMVSARVLFRGMTFK